MGLTSSVNSHTFDCGIRKKHWFDILITIVILYESELSGHSTTEESQRKIEQIKTIL